LGKKRLGKRRKKRTKKKSGVVREADLGPVEEEEARRRIGAFRAGRFGRVS
jgi:hypothetical protein